MVATLICGIVNLFAGLKQGLVLRLALSYQACGVFLLSLSLFHA